MTDALIRHEVEMCYIERAMKKAKGYAKKDLQKHWGRMQRQRLEYLRHMDGCKEVEKQSEKSL